MTKICNAPPDRPRTRPPRSRRWSSAGLAGCVALAVASLLGASPARAETSAGPLDLARYKGKVVYLDFWASWCGPCKLSFPYMEKMTMAYPRDSFVVIAVNVDHSKERAEAFLRQTESTVPVIYDPTGVIAKRFHVSEMPTSILIGRDGRVRYIQQGFFENNIPQYEAHIEELVNAK